MTLFLRISDILYLLTKLFQAGLDFRSNTILKIQVDWTRSNFLKLMWKFFFLVSCCRVFRTIASWSASVDGWENCDFLLWARRSWLYYCSYLIFTLFLVLTKEEKSNIVSSDLSNFFYSTTSNIEYSNDLRDSTILFLRNKIEYCILTIWEIQLFRVNELRRINYFL